jgi:transposase
MSKFILDAKQLKKFREHLYPILQILDTMLYDSEKESADVKSEQPEKCPGCGKMHSFFHLHHIVPRSVGGLDEISNIIKICEECHSKVHMRKSTSLSTLIKAGIAKAKEEGRIGAPPNKIEQRIVDQAAEMRATGMSLRAISKELGISTTSVQRINNSRKD